MDFRIFTDLCSHHSRTFSSPWKETPCSLAIPPCNPPPPAPWQPLIYFLPLHICLFWIFHITRNHKICHSLWLASFTCTTFLRFIHIVARVRPSLLFIVKFYCPHKFGQSFMCNSCVGTSHLVSFISCCALVCFHFLPVVTRASLNTPARARVWTPVFSALGSTSPLLAPALESHRPGVEARPPRLLALWPWQVVQPLLTHL